MGIERTIIEGVCDGCNKKFSVVAGGPEAAKMRQTSIGGKGLIFHDEDCEGLWMATPDETPKKKKKK